MSDDKKPKDSVRADTFAGQYVLADCVETGKFHPHEITSTNPLTYSCAEVRIPAIVITRVGPS